MSYKLTSPNKAGKVEMIIRETDPIVYIPTSEDNIDYQEYLAWVAEGNTAKAAD